MAAWTAVTITIAFLIIKATVGLRVSEEEEIVGLDSCVHGLPSAYAGFSIMDISNTMTMEVNENTSLGVSDYDTASATMKEAAVKVETAPAAISGPESTKVVVIAKLAVRVLKALNDLGVTEYGHDTGHGLWQPERRCRRDVSWSGNGCDPAS